MRPRVPARRSRVIGRDHDLTALQDLVLHGDGRLVTLTGAGGVGKTTLALELGRIFEDRFDFTWLVDLSSIPRDAGDDEVAARWIDALGLVAPTGSPVEILAAHLRAREALLLVDNCEQVAAACAGIVDRLLDGCPYLRVVATSRAPLKVRGETVYPVGPLAIPDAELLNETGIPASSAVELFTVRAHQADPAFRLTGEHQAAVVRICRRLAGLPLAIELAAAHVHALSPVEIEQRLAPALGNFAREGPRTPARQVTLRATMDWSYQLLGPRQQRLFRRLSVFSGGWTLEAAETVCGGQAGDADVQAALEGLIEQSLVVRESSGRGSRFRFLEPIGEYAAALLRDSGEAAAVASRHAEFFRGMASRRDPGATEPTAEQMSAVAADHLNCLAALRYAQSTGNGSLALDLSVSLAFLWNIHGHLHEGLTHLRAALALTDPGPSWARAVGLLVVADVERLLGIHEAAVGHATEALGVCEVLHEPIGQRAALATLGDVAAASGDYAAAHAHYRDARRFLDAQPRQLATGYWHAKVGQVLLREGRTEEAARELQTAVDTLADTHEDWYTGRSLCWLGTAERRRGRLPQARAALTKGLEVLVRYGDRVDSLDAAEELARISVDQGEFAAAATLLGAAAALRDAMALPPGDTAQPGRTAGMNRARRGLRATDFAAAWTRGRALSLDDLVAFSRAPVPHPGPRGPEGAQARRVVDGVLTGREHEVAQLIAQGMTNPQIAQRLFVSTGTVRSHVEHILGKLGLTSRVQVATWVVGAVDAGPERPVSHGGRVRGSGPK